MEAIVLARRDWREYDQLVTLYTREQGKVEVIARGIKKITSKNSSFLEPFALLEVEIIPGKDRRYIGTVAALETYPNIRRDLGRALVAETALAVLNTLIVGEEPDAPIFKLIVNFFKFLNAAPPAKNSLDKFMVKLAGYLGLAPPVGATTHPALLRHLRYYSGLMVADWNVYQRLV